MLCDLPEHYAKKNVPRPNMTKTYLVETINILIVFLFSSVNVLAGERAYTCEVLHVYKLSDDASLRTSGFEKQMKGSSFSVSRITGEIIGEVIPTEMAKKTGIVNESSERNSFKAWADFGNQLQLIEVQEFRRSNSKSFILSSMGGAGIVTGTCK